MVGVHQAGGRNRQLPGGSLGYAISGRLGVAHDDGTSLEIGAGEAYLIAPGHEAWVIGDEPFVGVEFKSAASYAK